MEPNISSIVCPNCGANSKNRHNCEYCGSMLIRFIDKDITIDDNIQGENARIIPGLVEAFKSNLLLQKHRIESSLILTQINSNKGIYQVVPMYDATYGLGVENPFSNKDEEGLVLRVPFMVRSLDSKIAERERKSLSAIKRFDWYKLFTEVENKDGTYLLLDCGGDYETAAILLSNIIYAIDNPTSISSDTSCTPKQLVKIDDGGYMTDKGNKKVLLMVIMFVCVLLFLITVVIDA